MSNSFPRYFNPEELGRSLKEVASDVIKTTHQDVLSRWFHSAKDADLFIWIDSQKNVLKQQLTYYGQVVEWNIVEGVKTGHVVEEEGHESRTRTEFLRFDQKPQPASIEQAIRLLECITALKDEDRKVLMENFRRISASQTMPPEEFIARFGSYFEGRGRSETPESPWKSLLRKLSSWFKS